MPQLCEPIHMPWSVPVPALDGSGAWVSVQEVPFCVSISPQVCTAASLYQPTTSQLVAELHADDAVYTFGFVAASAGRGASVVVHPGGGAAAPAGAAGATSIPTAVTSTTAAGSATSRARPVIAVFDLFPGRGRRPASWML
jgi:hypothetical protein